MKAPSPWNWVDGELVPVDQPVLRAGDPGFLLGQTVFETLLWEDGVLYFVEEHLERMARSGRELELERPRWDAREALGAYCAHLGPEQTAVRLSWTPGEPGRGASLIVSGRIYDPPDADGVGVRLVPRAKLAGDPLETWKTSSRLRNALARRRAREVGAWEALLGTQEGDYVEGTVSNLFAVLEGRLVTPPVARGALAGTIRDQLFALAASEEGLQLEEAPLRREDLARAEEVFLTNCMVRVAPVRWIHELRDDLPGGEGPRVREVRARLGELEAAYRAAHATDV